MKLKFLGATGTVTGSKYLIETKAGNLLVDCGLFQGLKELRLRNWTPLPIDQDKLKGVLLTHAHLDHSGAIPLLVKSGFREKIYCSEATYELCKILLPDSGRLQEEEAYYANQSHYSKHNPALPLYTEKDALAALHFFKPISFHEKFTVENIPLQVEFLNAGHILGSSMIRTRGKDQHDLPVILTFTGDLGRPHDPLFYPPETLTETDYLVIESTYGDQKHSEVPPEEQLKKIIHENQNGVIVIPAFSVGRSQTLLYHLNELRKKNEIPHFPIFLDSPMSIHATELFLRHREIHRLDERTCHEIEKISKWIKTPEESKALSEQNGPMVIISASGMATGGRVLHHLKRFAPDPKNTILLSGYQAEGTRGRLILNHETHIKMLGVNVPIRAKVAMIHGLSGHSDQPETLAFLSHLKSKPKKIFITHGEPPSSLALKDAIATRYEWDAVIPEYLQEFLI